MYKVTSDLTLKVKGVIKVFPAGCLINLPEKPAQMFMQQGKIVPVQEKPQVANNEFNYETYFLVATQRIAQNYQAGTIDYIRQNHPERWGKCVQAEDRINALWDKNLQEFQGAVDDWREIKLALIELYANGSGKGNNYEKN
ncbi:MAG: hypothetical protein HW406_937 [Candidatus Brocadiaceae bacterium]|nr:hypothetical protein [Candidatus Brocadiaceae bacterium]